MRDRSANAKAAWWQKALLTSTLGILFVLTTGNWEDGPAVQQCCTEEVVVEVLSRFDCVDVDPWSWSAKPGGDKADFLVTTVTGKEAEFTETSARGFVLKSSAVFPENSATANATLAVVIKTADEVGGLTLLAMDRKLRSLFAGKEKEWQQRWSENPAAALASIKAENGFGFSEILGDATINVGARRTITIGPGTGGSYSIFPATVYISVDPTLYLSRPPS